jgi:hypothetical protein
VIAPKFTQYKGWAKVVIPTQPADEEDMGATGILHQKVKGVLGDESTTDSYAGYYLLTGEGLDKLAFKPKFEKAAGIGRGNDEQDIRLAFMDASACYIPVVKERLRDYKF